MGFSGRFKVWLLAARPKTLSASIAPVVMGTAMAYGDGIHHWPTAFLCLVGAVLVQIGTNLANDYFDYKKGADMVERIGPTRVTQAGLIEPRKVLIGFTGVFALASLVGCLLIIRGGWPILAICILSIISGILYTGGPKPLGYIGLGDIFVLVFFGPVAVAGTYYVQSLEINTAVIVAGLGPGLLSVAILCVNNYRDIDGDRETGKRTLAVRFGRGFARMEYVFCLSAAAILPGVVYIMVREHILILLCIVMLLPAAAPIRAVLTRTDGRSLNHALASTGKLLMIYSIIFSIGWIV